MGEGFWTGYLIALAIISGGILLTGVAFLLWELGWRKGWAEGHRQGLSYHEAYVSELDRLKVKRRKEIDIPVPDKDVDLQIDVSLHDENSFMAWYTGGEGHD